MKSSEGKWVLVHTHSEKFENEKLGACQIILASVCRLEDIIDAIKTGNIKNIGLLEEETNIYMYSGNTKMLKTRKIINLDAISYSAKLEEFTLMDSNKSPLCCQINSERVLQLSVEEGLSTYTM